MTLGNKVKNLRLQNGMNQRELSSATDITQATISRIENGQLEELKLDTLKRLADGLGTTLDYLAGTTALGEGDPDVNFLINKYKGLSPENKQILMGFIRLLEKQEEKAGVRSRSFIQKTVKNKSKKK